MGAAWGFFALKTILLVPFYEEVVTRGFLYRAFRGTYGVPSSVFVVVLFSGYFHWSSVSRSLFTFFSLALLWVLLCIVRETTTSLWNCILCHSVYNCAGLHLWLPAAIALVLLLPFVVGPTVGVWRKRELVAVSTGGAEPVASPNGGPAASSGSSAVTEGPPSVS
jgi:membrane protease YdiL (CAAX protease family)